MQYDQKNIRRRVYDALNVLMAMNIISKEKKEIKWLGLPTNSLQEFQALEAEKQRRLERIKQKTQQLQELVLQQIAFKSLVRDGEFVCGLIWSEKLNLWLCLQVQRNKHNERLHGGPASNSTIQLPFLVVNTNKKTVIDCSISSDKMEYLFTFDDTFEIHDDIEVLKRMGMALGLDKADCSEENLAKVCSTSIALRFEASFFHYPILYRPSRMFQRRWNTMSTSWPMGKTNLSGRRTSIR